MSFFGSLEFFIWFTLLAFPAIILGLFQKPLRYYSFFASVFMLALVFGEAKKQLAFLVLFLFFELILIKLYLYLRRLEGKNKFLYVLFVLSSIFPLFFAKISVFSDIKLFSFIGISYLTFKIVQIILEIYDGIIKQISLFELLNFILFFPTLSSGPIDRSRRFKKDTDAIPSRKEYLNLLGTGLQKLFLGAVYKFVVSSFLFSKLGDVTGITGCSSLIKYIYTYGFFLFFDFAGYSLMAVGASYIFGIKTPDNFNKPFLSVDVRDFWNRWHITLSHWLRDFVFSRFIMNCMRKKWFSSRLLTAVLGLMLNMLIMGLWHGFSLCYVLYGVYHGVLLSVFEIYQKKSKFYKNNKNKFIYKLASWFITINLVMIGFMIFSLASYDKVILSWIYQKLT